ncbi:hypothetical protein HRW18_08295 [Streptomyces lunaelactis]|uniref:hypothetical protein n=1 Tax=Streptomyces lunaelactis TaxID=1535768 RepID=UPI001585194E|nr:hypothetical protein [Streptomyces lunaelactis]NUK08009.1 hypothetical protein [Streptomyces lunaelactis]NUL24406.1 hypothetical protein [Streptomyces lunaelactis]
MTAPPSYFGRTAGLRRLCAGIPGAGHLSSLERPDETTSLLPGFLAEYPPYPSRLTRPGVSER